MRIGIMGDDSQWSEIIKDANEKNFVRISSLPGETGLLDAYIILSATDIKEIPTQIPILLNSVVTTLTELNAGVNVLRINGWNGFLSGKTLEIAGIITSEVDGIFAGLNRQFIPVADKPGLVAARTVAMIINEAYFALSEEVSSKSEIDIAMKLGTNYPYGPFEWAEKIGIKNVYELLISLGKTDRRYSPAALLQQEAIA